MQHSAGNTSAREERLNNEIIKEVRNKRTRTEFKRRDNESPQ
jgi:hypothetical protein